MANCSVEGNSFRKPIQVKDESSAPPKKFSTTISKVTKFQPVHTCSVTAKSDRASEIMTTAEGVSITS